ncbi:MAG: N-acetylmuramoyl-L-alanine amidase [Archangium gephyra]|uniref:N-acetylmuramoyl-L-alanine amidase n=1 Tax=Archangium gephyra TaxID=48 RepID=A0A2W5VPN9_9BACT|nr:MAG: N-acetylmuramoyl-L-alanine amidase [Archangium gephyra]
MIRAVAITMLLLSSVPARAATADDAFRDAKDAYEKLKKDPKRRGLRHHWQNLAKKFEAIASKHPKSDRAPEALFNAGRLNNELSRISQIDDDRDAAKRAYKKLIDGWPKHKLSDDAAFALAKLLADRENDQQGARKVLEAALPNAGDMKKDITAMLAELPKPVAKVEVVKARPVSAPVAVKAVARVEPEPKKKQRAVVDDEAVASSPDVAEAIRRAIKPLQDLNQVEPTPTPVAVQARRTVPRRDVTPEPSRLSERDEAPASDDVVEEDEPVVASLAERLRDVRVGARQPGKDDADARSRFKKLASAQRDDEISLAQQLGLKVRRVIIDAGHGGHDTGAIGPGGTREKDVALAIAKKLAARLEEAGLEVILTRDDDTFVKLEERTRLANRQKGDLFISVHCNAAPSTKMRGIETYTLNTSSNRYSIRLSARENATTERGVGDLQYILADLATKANTGESSRLADRVQRSLIRNLSADYKGVKDLGTKEALFFVLLGAKMPAILVETSFLSHPEEEERLADEKYQSKVADSIAEAVGGFLEDRNKLAQVD